MALNQKKYEYEHEAILRDVRPLWTRIADGLSQPSNAAAIFFFTGGAIYLNDWALAFADLIMVFLGLFFWWLTKRDRSLAFKLPMGAKFNDGNNEGPGKNGEAEGILYLGNTDDTNEEVWF